MDELLACRFEQNLGWVFAGQTSSIPLPILARSLAGICGWVIRYWFVEHPPISAEDLARSIQRLAHSVIREALSRVE